jgi:hypothetical protein
MDTAVIAQLVTGVATLIVASVLIWQMVMQRKSLEMAHRDNEQSLAFSSLELTDKLLAVRMEDDFSKVWVKRNNSEKDLNEEEFEKLNNYYLRWFTVMNTEWRMGRLTNEPDMYYYRRKLWAMLNSQCGQGFYIREGRDFIRFDRLRKLADDLYGELSGTSIPAPA